MYKVYILQSTINNRYYIGHTDDVENRLKIHNLGRVKSTKAFFPWKVVYVEYFKTRSEAQKREYEIKSYKSGIKFKKLLGLWND